MADVESNYTMEVPEEESNLYYRKDTLSEQRVKRLSVLDNSTSYFGDIYLGYNEEETGSGWTTLFAAPRGVIRGTAQLYGSAQKAGVSFKTFVGDSVYDLYSSSLLKNQTEEYMTSAKQKLDSGEITQEDYDSIVKGFDEEYLKIVNRDTTLYNKEKEKTLNLMRRIDEHTQAVIKKLGVERVTRDWKWFADLTESVPSTLASIGVFALLKSPAASAAVLGSLSGTATMGETAQQVLEKGGTTEQAFGVGLTTGAVSGSLETLGGLFLAKLWNAPLAQKAAKTMLRNKLGDWVMGQTAKGAVSKPLSVATRAGIAGMAEEGLTETMQAVVETELPRAFGFGENFDSMFDLMSDWFYQGWIGALSGGLFGAGGTYITAKNFHKQVVDRVVYNGGTIEQAQGIADRATEVFMKKDEEAKKRIDNEINSLNTDPESVDSTISIMETLMGGMDTKEKSELAELNSRFKKQLDAKMPQGSQTGENEVGSALLTETTRIISENTGAPIQDVSNSIVMEVRDDIDPTNKENTLHAVDKEGNIIGETVNGAGRRLLSFIRKGDPLAVVHETSHLFMNAIAEAYSRFKMHPERLSPVVLSIIERYGEPNSDKVQGYFSEEQQEAFASDIVKGILEGESISPEMDSITGRIRKTLHTIDDSMSKGSLKDKTARKVFATIFAKEEAVLPKNVPTKERIAELKQIVKDIMKGGTPTVKDLLELGRLFMVRRGARPYTIGYTLSDYISEHPEYNEMSAEQKFRELVNFGFDLKDLNLYYASTYTPGKTNVQAVIDAVESNPEGLVLESEQESKVVAEKQARYDQAVEAANEIFEGVNIRELSANIQELRSKGFVVLDQNTVTKAVESIESLTERTEELSKETLDSSKTIARRAIRVAETIANNLDLAGIDTTKIRQRIQQLRETVKTQDKDAINSESKELVSRIRTAVDEMSLRYFKSERFLQDNGIFPPQVSKEILSGQIGVALMNAGRKVNISESFDKATLLAEVRKVLAKNKIPASVQRTIIAKIAEYSFNELTGPASVTISQTILDEISRDYQRKMTKRIRSEWDKLISAERANKVAPEDKMAIEWMDKNIMEGRKTNPQLAALKFDEPIGVTSEGEPVYLNYEQKELASALRAVKWKEYLDPNEGKKGELMDTFAVGNEQLAETYVSLKIMSNVSRGFPARFEAQERERIADLKAEAINTIKQRKGLPRLLTAIDSWIMAGWLGGLRSNLISYFGYKFGNDMDIISAQRAQEALRAAIFRDVRNNIANMTNKLSDTYLAALRTEKPFMKAKKGTPQYLLKDYTRGQILSIWLLYRDADGNETLSSVFGDKVDEVFRAIDERPTFVLDRNMGIIMSKHLANLYPMINSEYIKINGVPMGQVENYWPHDVRIKGTNDIITDMNGLFVPHPSIKGDPRFTKSRTNNLNNVELIIGNAYDVFTKYVTNATKFIYTTRKLNDLSRIINDETLKEEFVQKYNQAAWKALHDDIEFNMKIATNKQVDYLSKVGNEMISNAIVATLGLKFWSALKQVPSFINYASKMPVGSFMRFAPNAIVNFKDNWKRLQEEYPMLKSRYTDSFPAIWGSETKLYEEGLTGLFGDGAVRDPKNLKKLTLAAGIQAKAKETFMMPIRIGDFAAVSLGASIYESYLKEQIEDDPEMSKWSESRKHDWIEKELVIATETTQQSGLSTTKGGWQRSDSALARSLMAFTSQQAQYVRNIREAAFAYVNGEISMTEMLKRTFLFGVIAPFIYAALSSPAMYVALWKGMFGGEDDKWKKELYLSMVRPLLDNVFSAWGMMGGFVTYAADVAAQKAGQKHYGLVGGVVDPFLMKDITKALTSLSKENVSGEDYLNASLGIVQLGVPIPLQRMKNMLKGTYKMFDEGQLFYFGQILGISENQTKRLIEELNTNDSIKHKHK